MSAADDALDVARFCWPDGRWAPITRIDGGIGCRDLSPVYPDFRPTLLPSCIAAAERVLVERGLGEEYGVMLMHYLDCRGDTLDMEPSPLLGELRPCRVAEIRTAPLEVCLRALARVVREKQPKETK